MELASLIDWFGVLANALLIFGLALLLAVASYRNYSRATTPAMHVWAWLGASLACFGIALTATPGWLTALWALISVVRKRPLSRR